MKSSNVGKVRGVPPEAVPGNVATWSRATRGGGGVLDVPSCPWSVLTRYRGTTMIPG